MAKEKELQVLRVYRDVEKYRVGNRLVEPSGRYSSDELVAEVMIDGKLDIQVAFRAKIMDQAVRKQLLDFPNGGDIVVRL